VLEVPRREGLSRATFVQRVMDSFSNLYEVYEGLPILSVAPDWAENGQGRHVFFVSLPINLARSGMDAHAISGMVKNLIERGKTKIRNLARVEHDNEWFFWVEID